MVKIHLQYKYQDVPCPFKNPVVSVALRGICNTLLRHFSMKIISIAYISAYSHHLSVPAPGFEMMELNVGAPK